MNYEDSKNSLQRIADSIPSHPFFHGDSQNGLFAKQLVIQTFAELFRHEYPATKWANGGLISVNTSINEGAESYAYQEMEHSGRAEIGADGATDIPLADIEGQNNILPVKSIHIGFQYNRQQIRSARMNGAFDVATEKAQSAREAYDRSLDGYIRTGVPSVGLRGVVNHPGIIIQNAATGNWASASGVQIVADITAAINTVSDSSDAVEMPDTVLFDVASWNLVSTKVHLPDASDRTILSFLREAFPMIRRWDWEPGMKSVGANGGASMLVYRNSARHLRAVMPMMLMAHPPQERGYAISVPMEARFGGVMMPRPRSVLRLDGI